MVDPKETINIENVVASTGIGQELDLQSVAMDLEGADYDPEQFPGLVYRTQEPKSAALIFRSGKIVCTGAKSTDDVHESLRIVFDKLRDLNIQVDEEPEIVVQNIVTSTPSPSASGWRTSSTSPSSSPASSTDSTNPT